MTTAGAIAPGPLPRAFTALIRKAKGLPLGSPVMVALVALLAYVRADLATPLTTGVTTYFVIAAPLAADAFQWRIACPLPDVLRGVPGAVGVPTVTSWLKSDVGP